MEVFLYVLSGLFLIVGFVGCILPILPGPTLSYLGLIILHLSEKVQFSTSFLVLWGIIIIAVQVLDYFMPMWSTKKFGGSRLGIIGSAVGLVVGLFFGPIGIVFGPFIGALIAELLNRNNFSVALKSAFGAFVGFIIGTVSKLVIASLLIYYSVIQFI